MISSIFRKPSNNKEIKQYLSKGKLNRKIPVDLMEGLVLYVDLFLKEGFLLTQINEISSIGQIIADQGTLEKIKGELTDGTFKGGYSTGRFDIKENYIDFMQVTLDNGESYAVAYNSPGDYWGTFVGILWVLKLKERLNISQMPNTHLDFTK